MYTGLWIVIVVILRANGQQLTLVSNKPNTNLTYVEEYQNAITTCLVENLAGKTVQWNHNGKQIALVANGETVIFTDPKFQTKYTLTGAQANGGNFSLTIHNFTDVDAGEVVCDISGISPVGMYFIVLRHPTDIQISFQTSNYYYEEVAPFPILHVDAENWLNLTCKAYNSRPQADITWVWNATNPIVEWRVTRLHESKNNRLYNTTSMLYLPPRFSIPLFRSTTAENITLAGTTNTTSIEAVVPISSQTMNSTITEDTPIVDLIDHFINFTCTVAAEENVYMRSLLIHIGPFKSGSSNMDCTSCIHLFVFAFLHLLIHI